MACCRSAVANCHFLPAERRERAVLQRHAPPSDRAASRAGIRQWRIGLQFDDLPPASQNRIQRYIDRLERERRELM